MADVTAKLIMEQDIPQRLAAKPEIRKEINAVIHFDISGANGGKWTLDATKDADWIVAGAVGTPKLTLMAKEEDFVAVCTRKLNPNMAAMSGKLKFKPMDLGLAMKLGKLLA
jgi:putative sterol carrier protein